MAQINVRIGFVPSLRFRYTEWTQKMRLESLAVFASIPGMEVIVPQEPLPGADGKPEEGYTPHGMVQHLGQGEEL
jgi:hypothetical protein